MRRGITIAFGVAALFAGPGAGAAWADFVCPVLPISQQGVTHNNAPNFMMIGGGDYSIIGPTVSVPDRATTSDGLGGANGTGKPPGAHASPGDSGYTAIWKTP